MINFVFMEFSKETLNDIIEFGALGKTLFEISMELNTTFDKIDDERKKNKELDDALCRSEKNYSMYRIDRIEKSSNPGIMRDVYARHLEKIGDVHSDNEIIIKRV